MDANARSRGKIFQGWFNKSPVSRYPDTELSGLGLYLLAVFYIDYHHKTCRIIDPIAEEKSVDQNM